jgi:hypothetical protein
MSDPLSAASLEIGDRVTCDGDPGVVIWINVGTNDTKVRFGDGEEAYVHPSDLRRS